MASCPATLGGDHAWENADECALCGLPQIALATTLVSLSPRSYSSSSSSSLEDDQSSAGPPPSPLISLDQGPAPLNEGYKEVEQIFTLFKVRQNKQKGYILTPEQLYTSPIGTTASLGIKEKSFTIETWVNLHQYAPEGTSNLLLMIESRHPQYTHELSLYFIGGRPVFTLCGHTISAKNYRLNIDTWYHLAFLFDAVHKTMTIYINGEVAGFGHFSSLNFIYEDLPVYLYQLNFPKTLLGSIINLRMWPCVMSFQQILRLMRLVLPSLAQDKRAQYLQQNNAHRYYPEVIVLSKPSITVDFQLPRVTPRCPLEVHDLKCLITDDEEHRQRFHAEASEEKYPLEKKRRASRLLKIEDLARLETLINFTVYEEEYVEPIYTPSPSPSPSPSPLSSETSKSPSSFIGKENILAMIASLDGKSPTPEAPTNYDFTSRLPKPKFISLTPNKALSFEISFVKSKIKSSLLLKPKTSEDGYGQKMIPIDKNLRVIRVRKFPAIAAKSKPVRENGVCIALYVFNENLSSIFYLQPQIEGGEIETEVEKLEGESPLFWQWVTSLSDFQETQIRELKEETKEAFIPKFIPFTHRTYYFDQEIIRVLANFPPHLKASIPSLKLIVQSNPAEHTILAISQLIRKQHNQRQEHLQLSPQYVVQNEDRQWVFANTESKGLIANLTDSLKWTTKKYNTNVFGTSKAYNLTTTTEFALNDCQIELPENHVFHPTAYMFYCKGTDFNHHGWKLEAFNPESCLWVLLHYINDDFRDGFIDEFHVFHIPMVQNYRTYYSKLRFTPLPLAHYYQPVNKNNTKKEETDTNLIFGTLLELFGYEKEIKIQSAEEEKLELEIGDSVTEKKDIFLTQLDLSQVYNSYNPNYKLILNALQLNFHITQIRLKIPLDYTHVESLLILFQKRRNLEILDTDWICGYSSKFEKMLPRQHERETDSERLVSEITWRGIINDVDRKFLHYALAYGLKNSYIYHPPPDRQTGRWLLSAKKKLTKAKQRILRVLRSTGQAIKKQIGKVFGDTFGKFFDNAQSSENYSYYTLDIAEAQLDLEDKDLDADYLALFLATNKSVEEISFMGNRINPKGLAKLANALCKNKTLKRLYLTECQLEHTCFDSILKILSQNEYLEIFDISENPNLNPSESGGNVTVVTKNETQKKLEAKRMKQIIKILEDQKRKNFKFGIGGSFDVEERDCLDILNYFQKANPTVRFSFGTTVRSKLLTRRVMLWLDPYLLTIAFFSEFFQFVAFPFTIDLPWQSSNDKQNEHIQKLLDILRGFQFDFDHSFVQRFWFVIMLVLLFVEPFLPVLGQWSSSVYLKSAANSKVFLLWTFLVQIISTSLFLPMVRTIVSGFDCTYNRQSDGTYKATLDYDPTILCWRDEHIPMALAALVLLPLFLLYALRLSRVEGFLLNISPNVEYHPWSWKQDVPEQTSTAMFASHSTTLRIVTRLSQFILACLSLLFSNYKLFLLFIYLIVSLCIIIETFRMPPYRDIGINALKTGFYFAVAWTNLLGIILQYNQTKASFLTILWLSGFVPAILVGGGLFLCYYICVRHKFSKIESKDMEMFSRQQERQRDLGVGPGSSLSIPDGGSSSGLDDSKTKNDADESDNQIISSSPSHKNSVLTTPQKQSVDGNNNSTPSHTHNLSLEIPAHKNSSDVIENNLDEKELPLAQGFSGNNLISPLGLPVGSPVGSPLKSPPLKDVSHTFRQSKLPEFLKENQILIFFGKELPYIAPKEKKENYYVLSDKNKEILINCMDRFTGMFKFYQWGSQLGVWIAMLTFASLCVHGCTLASSAASSAIFVIAVWGSFTGSGLLLSTEEWELPLKIFFAIGTIALGVTGPLCVTGHLGDCNISGGIAMIVGGYLPIVLYIIFWIIVEELVLISIILILVSSYLSILVFGPLCISDTMTCTDEAGLILTVLGYGLFFLLIVNWTLKRHLFTHFIAFLGYAGLNLMALLGIFYYANVFAIPSSVGLALTIVGFIVTFLIVCCTCTVYSKEGRPPYATYMVLFSTLAICISFCIVGPMILSGSFPNAAKSTGIIFTVIGYVLALLLCLLWVLASNESSGAAALCILCSIGIVVMAIVGAIGINTPVDDLTKSGAITMTIIGFFFIFFLTCGWVALAKNKIREFLALVVLSGFLVTAIIGSVTVANPGIIDLSHQGAVCLAVMGWIMLAATCCTLQQTKQKSRRVFLNFIIFAGFTSMAITGSMTLSKALNVDVSHAGAIAMTVLGWIGTIFFCLNLCVEIKTEE